MRAVFVNHCHPQMDHVCAVRMATFASAMAQRGHQIVLLCGAGSGDVSIADHRVRMANHDWSNPYTLPCKPAPAPLLERLHQGRLPSGVRQAVVAVSYLLQGGVFNNWRRGADDAINFLASDFKPDIAWATFGNTDAWNIGRDLAQRAGCPWVADMKDNWDHYIPGPFRSWLSGRYGTAARFTALSQAHGDLVSRRFGTAAQVIYSGFGNPQEATPKTLRLVITGSIYDGQMLAIMVEGVRTWLQYMPLKSGVEVCYFGNDWKTADRVLAPLDAHCRVLTRSFLAPDELAPLLAGATAILYPRHGPMLYHHKFGDYMATGRPVICLPGETAECRDIAKAIHAPFFSCEDADQVDAALRAVAAGDFPKLDNNKLAAYSWPQQAEILEGVFMDAIGS